MPAKYILVTVHCDENLIDLLIAGMANLGYDAFISQENGFQASVTAVEFDRLQLLKLFRQHMNRGFKEFFTQELEEQNWNEQWEKFYEPVIISQRCIIRASFHQTERSYPIEIVINPKMSFGTGHHETTRLMAETQLDTVHIGKSVLDVGCGTGILSILAEKLGADKILGLDIDSRAFENAQENIRINDCNKIRIRQTGLESLDKVFMFDIILANINRHIILQDAGLYGKHLAGNGLFICSGFLNTDVDLVVGKAEENKMDYLSGRFLNKWAVLVFRKNQ